MNVDYAVGPDIFKLTGTGIFKFNLDINIIQCQGHCRLLISRWCASRGSLTWAPDAFRKPR
jgi:hypothetical protein